MSRATGIDRAVVYPADTLTERLNNVVYPAAGGITSLAVANANTTYQPEDVPSAYVKLTGTLTAARTYVLSRDAGTPKSFVVENATSGGYAVTIKVASGGAGIAIPAGYAARLSTLDGTNTELDKAAHGIGGALFLGYQHATGDPSTTQFPASGNWGLYQDDTGPKIYLALHLSGHIYRVELVEV